MKNNRSKRSSGSPKALIIASVIGAAAIGAATIAAYNSTMRRLVPTNTSGADSTNTWVFSEPNESKDPSEPVSGSEKATSASDAAQEVIADPLTDESPAEEANRPVEAKIGNIMPVDGEISNPFSNGELVKSETLGVWKTHDGCDILCPLGTDVKSMSHGVVTEITDDPLWGVCIAVEQSNGLWVQYCGLAKELTVKAGQEIKQGEIIGKTSDTCQIEISQEPHLHLGVKQGDKWVDPMLMIEDGEQE